MDPLTISVAGGLRSRLESLDVLANNLANSETGGYKGDREFYSLFSAAEANQSGAPDPSTLPVVERNWTDFSQGVIRSTSNPTDLALDGKGFFAVDSPSGPLYTRNGAFRVSSTGVLTTADGNAVRGVGGKPITLDSARDMTVASDGTVTQNGQVVGQLEVVDFDDPSGLTKQGATSFRPADPKVQPRPATAQVQQGRLENSNSGGPEAAVRLVTMLRQFEMLQKAANIGADMNKQAIQDVAHVGS